MPAAEAAARFSWQEAEAQGAKSLECFRDNHGARRFYERHGWQVAREYEREFAGQKPQLRLLREGLIDWLA